MGDLLGGALGICIYGRETEEADWAVGEVSCIAVSVELSASPTGSSEAGMTLEFYPVVVRGMGL